MNKQLMFLVCVLSSTLNGNDQENDLLAYTATFKEQYADITYRPKFEECTRCDKNEQNYLCPNLNGHILVYPPITERINYEEANFWTFAEKGRFWRINNPNTFVPATKSIEENNSATTSTENKQTLQLPILSFLGGFSLPTICICGYALYTNRKVQPPLDEENAVENLQDA